MSSWLCRFDIHNWSTWELYIFSYTIGKDKQVYKEDRQKRKCQRCGFTEDRRLR